jgi:hypothetical protein
MRFGKRFAFSMRQMVASDKPIFARSSGFLIIRQFISIPSKKSAVGLFLICTIIQGAPMRNYLIFL